MGWLNRCIDRLKRSVGAEQLAQKFCAEELENRFLLAFGASISINDISVQEGNGGGTNAVFTVSLTAISIAPVSVQYQTADGTALAGSDYTPVSGSLIFTPGERTKSIVVPVTGDTRPESNEQFTVNFTNPVGAPIDKGQGTCTIVDDDEQTVEVTATDAKASEVKRDPGTFHITRSGPTDSPLKVYFGISGTATNAVDYNRLAGSVTIAAGKSFANVVVKPLTDNLDEATETVILKLSSRPAYIVGSARTATVKIADRDATAPTASAIAGPITQPGGTEYQFSVTYTDNKLVDAATLGNGDVQVIGPNGFLQNAQLVSKTPSTNAAQITAVYRITPPGGAWDAADSGPYTISVVAGQVKDKSGNALAAGALGTFNVTVSP
jgi:hypothetical protein